MTQILNKHKVVFYDNIEDLPISQFHRYGKYLLVEGGIGDNIADIDAHITRIAEFLGRDNAKAHQELLNLRRCLYNVATEQDVSHKAVLCLVRSVDGEEWKDFSDSGIHELYLKLREERLVVFDSLAKEIGNKIDEDLLAYFPSMFDSSIEKNKTDLLRKRAFLQLSHILEGKDTSNEIEAVTREIMRLTTPQCFEGEKSEEIAYDKRFEEMCLGMAEKYGGRVKDYSVMEFYTAYTRMEREFQELRKKTTKKK